MYTVIPIYGLRELHHSTNYAFPVWSFFGYTFQGCKQKVASGRPYHIRIQYTVHNDFLKPIINILFISRTLEYSNILRNTMINFANVSNSIQYYNENRKYYSVLNMGDIYIYIYILQYIYILNRSKDRKFSHFLCALIFFQIT